MITVWLNDKQVDLQNPQLDVVVQQWQGDEKACAVAVNETFIPKSCYAQTVLQDGDRVELLTPSQGG